MAKNDIVTLVPEQQPLKDFAEKAYLDYSMYVIFDRALAASWRWFKTRTTPHYLRNVGIRLKSHRQI